MRRTVSYGICLYAIMLWIERRLSAVQDGKGNKTLNSISLFSTFYVSCVTKNNPNIFMILGASSFVVTIKLFIPH